MLGGCALWLVLSDVVDYYDVCDIVVLLVVCCFDRGSAVCMLSL